MIKSFLITMILSLSIFSFTQTGFAHYIAKIDHETITSKNGICAYIPELDLDKNKTIEHKINALVQDPIKKAIQEYEAAYHADKIRAKERKYCLYVSYAVKFNKNELFSMTTNTYQYTGGAHGNSWQNSVTADLKTGNLYTLKDLFKQDVDYKAELNKIIKQKKIDPNIDFKGVDEKTQFYITEEALVIYYQQYEIAAYVYGMPTFVIPCEQIKDLFTEEVQNALQRK